MESVIIMAFKMLHCKTENGSSSDFNSELIHEPSKKTKLQRRIFL